MLLQRDVENIGEYDVVVCGGGPAGFCAAVQAGRLGCRAAIFENYGMLGGTMTVGGVPAPALFHAFGKQIIRGIGWELMVRLAKEGWAHLPQVDDKKSHPEMAVKVNGPMAAHFMDIMCKEANVDLYFHQPAVDVVCSKDKVVEGIIISTKSGLKYIKGKVFIDCTGDGDIAAWCGADFELGENDNNELQPGTLRFYIDGYNTKDTDASQLKQAFMEGRRNGVLKHGDVWYEKHGNPYGILSNNGQNVNHVFPIDGSDSKSRSEAEVKGRESVARISNWLRKYVKGCEKAEPSAIAPEVGVRESRRIKGDRYITGEDYISARVYEDSVCYSFYPIDIHTDSGSGLKNVFLEYGRIPTIPLGALHPVGFHNLLTAGRCISGDRAAQSAYRVQASCMAMGQSAGAAASLAVKHNAGVMDGDINELKATLRSFNAIVPENL